MSGPWHRLSRPARVLTCCALAAAGWALTPSLSQNAERAAPPANQAPVLAVPLDGVRVRAGEQARLVVEALDPDEVADGATEAVWLGAALQRASREPVPAWLPDVAWSTGPSERPRLEIDFRPPIDAAPDVLAIELGATDARGLSAFANVEVTVLPPKCGPLEIEDGEACGRCPEHRLPDGSRTFCEPCPPGTERSADSPSCTDCPAGLASAGGSACAAARIVPKAAAGPGGATAKSSAATDATPPTMAAAHYSGDTVTLALSEPVWAEEPAAGNDFVVRSTVAHRVGAVAAASRQADASELITLTLDEAIAGSANVVLSYVPNRRARRQPRDAAGNRMRFHTVDVLPRRTLTVAFDGVGASGIGEDAGEVGATLALDNPPAAGGYTGCGLRFAAGSVAGAADAAPINGDQALNPGNGWRVSAKLLRVADDALAEGDEALAVEAFCTGGAAGMNPPASGLASTPATAAVADNESRTIALAADPAAIRETAGATPVKVTATLDGQATERLELALTLGGTAAADDYRATGTRRIAIEAGATGGSTVLTITPVPDADDVDETVSVSAALAGYALSEATVALLEPAPPPTLAASVDSAQLREDAGAVGVRLTLENPPESGGYAGCGLRLAAGSEAESPADVTFPNRKRLRSDNGWTTQGKLLQLVDDALAEGDEALVVEAHCRSRDAGTEPAAADLVSKPLRLVVKDNDKVRPLTLSVAPGTIGETLGEQAVRVTATVADAPSSALAVALDLGSGSYTAVGPRRVTIPAGATSGAATLLITPAADGNAVDDAVAIGGTAPGHAVTGTSLTIAEPTVVGGTDLSGLSLKLAVSPTAIREGASGSHRIGASLEGVDVPTADVSMVLAVGGTATRGGSHDYRLNGAAGWKRLTVKANDAHLAASGRVTVTARADGAEEGEETVTFTVGQVVWGTTAVRLRTPAVATLRITEAWETPMAPTGLDAVPSPGNETHGLDVSWSATAATPPVEGYVVRHREAASPRSAWTETEPQPGTATAVAGLNAGTRYEIRVYGRNAAGDGPESGSAYAYTADGGCPMAAPALATPAGARSSSELDLSWRAPACGASVAGYRVRHRRDPDLETAEGSWTEFAAAGTSAALTSLAADTAYVAAVRAVIAGGDKGPWSPEGKGRTGLDTRMPPRMGAPAAAPHAVDGASRLEVTWRRVAWTDGNDVAHPISEYQYRYRADGGAWTAAVAAQAASGETAAMTRSVSGLAAGTWHEVQVRAVNRMRGTAHPGKWSEPGRGRTWGAPDRVEEPTAILTGQAVEVVWDAPHDGGSPITDYDVEYRTEGSSRWRTHSYAGCAMGACATRTSINGLARKVRVRAENAVGMGQWSRGAKVESRKLLRASYGAAAASVLEGESLLVTVRLDSAADRAVSAPVTTNGEAGAFRLDGLSGQAAAFGLGTREQTFTFVALQDDDAAGEKVTLGFGTLPDGVSLATPASMAVTITDDEAANGSPTFGEGAAATRTVAENAAAGTAVGAPLKATDPDGDPLTYRLGGTHAALFTVDGSSGQLKVGAGAGFDFEGAVNSYAVTVEVSDGKDASGAADAAADDAISVTVDVTDLAEPPGAPAAPTLTSTAKSLAAAWAAPDNAGPAITGYDLHYRPVGATDWTDAQLSGTATAATVGGLAAGTAYEVRVRAASDEGAGGWSAVAVANTLPAVSLSAPTLSPDIPKGDAAATVTLSALPGAAGGGTLKGAWLERDGEGTVTVLDGGLPLTDGTAVRRAVSSAAPGPRTFGFRATHTLAGRTGESTGWVTVNWRPQVVLSASPSNVAEDGGAAGVTVTATLTGTALTDAAKTVGVSVSGGTATEGDDFKAVDDFTVRIAGGARSAVGSFTLTPVPDASREGSETVEVSGAASDGRPLTVLGTAVRIVDAEPKLTVATSVNGTVTGTTGSGDGRRTVIDCGGGQRTTCSATLAAGTRVTLTATADRGYLLGGWIGACSGTGACEVKLDGDRAVGAKFAAARKLTVAAPSHGKVVGKVGKATVIDCGSDCEETVADGTRIALSATAGSGHRFSRWGGACASAPSADCSVVLTADRTVSVAFASKSVDGQCDETAVDACAAGAPNAAAASDTDSHHRWRCDGSGGGANSRICARAKAGCSAGGRDWTVGANACAGSVTDAASGQARAASDGVGPATGSASFKCDDGAWSEQPGGVCGRECAGGTRAQCELATTAHGGSSGACGANSTGSCSYSCSDGAWTWRSGQCNARCPTSSETWRVGDDSCADTLGGGVHGATRTASDNAGSARGSASFKCDDGDWLEQSGSTCERECRATTHSWRVGSAQCSARLEALPSQWSDLAEDDTYPDTGTARYACDDGAWQDPTSARCRKGCAAATIDDCVLGNGVHNDRAGSCAKGSGSCSYRCDDGAWERQSNSCRADCDAGTETWTVGGNSCTGTLDWTRHGADRTATDGTHTATDLATGSATYRCDDGAFDGPTNASCHAVCGAQAIDGCGLPATAHGGRTGSCLGSTGSCSYQCNDGVWAERSNSCPLNCGEATAKWTVDGDACEATLAPTDHGAMRTVKDSTHSATGSATYACSYGSFNGPTNASCKAGCAGDTLKRCKLSKGVHGDTSGACLSGDTGSCSYTCDDGTWDEGSNSCAAPTFTVRVHPVPTKGKVTGSGFTCPGSVCQRTYTVSDGKNPPSVELTAIPNAGYEILEWELSRGMCEGASQTSTCSFDVESDVDVDPQFSKTLKANAGGTSGTYDAEYFYTPAPFGGAISFYFATVTASATGGVPPYSFQWSGKPAGVSAYYVWSSATRGTKEVEVTVTDGNKNPDLKDRQDKATAVVRFPGSSDAVRGGAGSEFAFEVPLGSEAHFVWGGGGAVTARSADAGVLGVSVSSPVVRATGLAVGGTEVVMVTDAGELRLPVVVR